MADEKIFTKGFIFKQPTENAPDWVKGSIAINVENFTKFMEEHKKNGWLNINLKVSSNGNSYAELNTWEPKKADTEIVDTKETPPHEETMNIEDIPF